MLARCATAAPRTTHRGRSNQATRRKALAWLVTAALSGRPARASTHSEYGARSAMTGASVDADYPGTATQRMINGRERAMSLSESELSKDWDSVVRPKLLWAAGLKDLRNVAPGKGNTGHCFNDFNHVDATTMSIEEADNENSGRVVGMAYRNPLGEGIRAARDETMGEGGSWCTCILGSASEPPADVAHVQFRSKIAWKLVWVPGKNGKDFSRFVLVDDAGVELATGVPSGNLPTLAERQGNYNVVKGGRYARAADARSV